jgi:hypothetical protein
MTVLLHAGHGATEAAASAAYTESALVLAIGLIAVVALILYGARRYAND